MNNLYNFNANEIDAWKALSRESPLISRAIEGGANASTIAKILVDCVNSLHAAAIVSANEAQAASDMARAMIKLCPQSPLIEDAEHCGGCPYLKDKDCPARVYLAERKQPDAWEVKP